MLHILVIGIQWGDEGKGKIVDFLCDRADVVVRFQGGHNAGHTVMIDNNVYKLSLLPSGVLRGKLSYIGNGVVVDPWVLKEEIHLLESQGISINSNILKISTLASLILPYHIVLDDLFEDQAGCKKIGTTLRGIGPAYQDKIGRRALRIGDLLNKEFLKSQLEFNINYYNKILILFGRDPVNFAEILSSLNEMAIFLKPFMLDAMGQDLETRKHILFEGAQGTLLDVDHGSYPFVTSSNTVASAAFIGSGCGRAMKNTYIFGLMKAYTTRVGEGPFPTEIFSKERNILSERGKEKGTVTGRLRRCGWLDILLLKHAMGVNGVDGLILTKLDVLDTLETIKVCVGYRIDGQVHKYYKGFFSQAVVEPVYEEVEGWQSSTFGCKVYAQLPLQAKRYIELLENLLSCSIDLISTSPERTDIIFKKEIFI